VTGSAPRTAMVVAPAQLGEGGLGAAAGDMAAALAAHGLAVRYHGQPGRPGLLRSVAGRRPLRRFRPLASELDRRAVLRGIRAPADLAYVMPGFARVPAPTVVLHQATHHPEIVREQLLTARREVGGGVIFMTPLDVRRETHELRHVDLIRAESTSVADGLVERGIAPERVVLAPPGVDLARFLPGRRAERLQVAVVGPLALWKGLDVTVELKRMIGRTARFAVVGGPVCSWSRRLSRGLADVVYDDVATMLHESHVLILPSVSDGFGYVVLEAMASGVVPFVTPAAGAAEVARRVDPRCVQSRGDFAEAVAALLGELDLGPLGEAARRIALDYDREARARAAAAAVLDRLGGAAPGIAS
jgi:glycosyltransferase involved in cell wall biosynthesis